jgi:hypothetical protein
MAARPWRMRREHLAPGKARRFREEAPGRGLLASTPAVAAAALIAVTVLVGLYI